MCTILILGVFLTLIPLASAAQADATYSQELTLPVPPAASFLAAGTGDGWDISLTRDRVWNVFHHNNEVFVACHEQDTSERCWPALNAKMVRDESNRSFLTSIHSGTHIDQATGHLYTYAIRQSDWTGGVVCADTDAPDAQTNLFCGFTALTGPGESYLSTSTLSAPMLVGNRWYAYNQGYGDVGARHNLLCFDVTTATACAGQPFSLNTGGANSIALMTATAIGTRLYVNIDQLDRLACFDTTTNGNCDGAWPSLMPIGYNGAAFPLMDGAGSVTGVCVPNGINSCRALSGASVPTPTGMTSVINSSTAYNGGAVAIGPRVYVPSGYTNRVQCWDYSTGAGCPNFPRLVGSFMYTVNADPQRPTCLWSNADGGTRIHSFDAYTGGPCGQGSIRVLASQFIVPQPACHPAAYQSLQVIAPTRDQYTDGSVEFLNGAGNGFGIPTAALDDTGAANLVGLSLNTATGLPQFLITLNGAPSDLGNVKVRLTWTGDYDAVCVGPTTEITPEATTLLASVAGDGLPGPVVTVEPGESATGSALLGGENAAAATGTVTYTWYADEGCTVVGSAGDPLAITTAGTLPDSAPVTLDPGTYHLVASYSGDAGNLPSETACGNAVLIVQHPDTTPPVITAAATTLPNANGWYTGDVTVTFTCVDEDGGSGILTGDCPADQLLTGEGAAIASTSQTVADVAGNVSAPSNVVTVGIDRTAPVVTFSGATSYGVMDTVAITCEATDSLSDIDTDTCADVAGPAWSFAPGEHTLSATATDRAGHSAQASTSFTVTASPSAVCALTTLFSANNGLTSSLCNSLAHYESAVANGQDAAATAHMDNFLRRVEHEAGRKLTAEQASTLLAWAATL